MCKPALVFSRRASVKFSRPVAAQARALKLIQRVFHVCSPPLSARRKTADNTTFDTVCHNPAQRLHGLALEDYNSSKCEMKEVVGMGSQFFICSCSEDECNEDIFFTSGTDKGLVLFSLPYWIATNSQCL